MQPHIAQLNSLGWLWRQNGVELCVNIDGREMRIFVPLGRVVVAFHQELEREGFRVPPTVGGHSVGGLFDSIGKAFKSIGKTASRAVSRAASTVTRTASKWGSAALKGVTSNPLYNVIASGASFIPGLGSGVSAGMAAAAALGRGESLRDIGLAAAKNALPGGPVAAAAFDVAVGVAKGQRFDTIALTTARNQLPGGPAAKAAFDAGIAAVRNRSLSGIPGAVTREATSQLSRYGGAQLGRFGGIAQRAVPQFGQLGRYAGVAQRAVPQLGRFGSMFQRAPQQRRPVPQTMNALRRFGMFNAAQRFGY